MFSNIEINIKNKAMKQVIDISGMTEVEVKNLMKAEGYNLSNFSRVWRGKTIFVTVKRESTPTA